MVLLLLIDSPDIVLGACDVFNGEHGREHRMILVVVFVHSVAADRIKVFKLSKEITNGLESVAVTDVVDWVGFRHPRYGATLDLHRAT